MNEILKIVLSLSLSGSILIVILIHCKPLFKSKMSKTWQYYIWLAVIARLLLPFAPEHNLVGNLFQNYNNTASQSESNLLSQLDFMSQTSADTSPNTFSADSNAEDENNYPVKILKNVLLILTKNLGLLWLAVALILLTRKITIYQSFIKYIKAGRTPVDDINLLEQLGKAVEEANINTKVELYTNSLIFSPLLIGFFHPCIMLPGTDCSELDFQYTIRHELTHFKRKDMFYKWLMQTTVCLHWFNPLVHLMAHYVNQLCELSCDEVMIRHLNETDIRDYGNTLLGAIRSKGKYENSLASVTLHESKELLKERLDAIMNFKKQSNIIKALSFLLTFMICFGGVFTGAYAAAPASGQTTATEPAKDSLFHLSNHGGDSITKSGGFMAEDNQILTITVQSDIKGGFVDLFLFSPDHQEQRLTFSDTNETKTIALSAGRWDYNCTGFFDRGDITIIGTLSPDGTITTTPDKTATDPKPSQDTVLNLSNGEKNSMIQSGGFEAKDNQILTLSIQSDIKGGSVNLTLFSPTHQEQRLLFSGSNETKTITLTAGRWDYNCTGFFESGNITITGQLN